MGIVAQVPRNQALDFRHAHDLPSHFYLMVAAVANHCWAQAVEVVLRADLWEEYLVPSQTAYELPQMKMLESASTQVKSLRWRSEIARAPPHHWAPPVAAAAVLVAVLELGWLQEELLPLQFQA